MRFGRRKPVIEPALLFLRVAADDVAAWARERGVPCWVQQLPGGWVLARTATVDGTLAGSGQSPDDALRDWAVRTPDAYLVQEAVRRVRANEIETVEDDIGPAPWEAADPRPCRGLVAVPGDQPGDQGLLAHLQAAPAVEVFRDGWLLVPHDDPLWASTAAVVDDDAGLALMTQGDEVRLWLIQDGEPVADWEWSVTGTLVAIDRLPAGELGDEVRDTIFPARLGVEPLDDFGFPTTPRLVQALATDAPAAVAVPELIAALGLPDAARAHLLGEIDLADALDARVSQPARNVAAAVASSVWASERQRASAQSPRRRLWGAIGWAASLVLCALLAVLIVDDLRTGTEISVWTWLRLPMVLLIVPVAILGIRRWWVLRGTGQRDASGSGGPPRRYQPRTSWWYGRGPSATVTLLIGLAVLALPVGFWIADAPLRDRGVQTTAQVVAVNEDSFTVTFSDRGGTTRTAEIAPWGEPEAGDPIVIVYDPLNPTHATSLDEQNDPVGYIVFTALAGLCLVLALLTWLRVIDWQRVSNWME
ncbi:MAG: hypothetical protein QM582_09875 [Micropruina sp.]|uniref:DUF3592 domain-containing protein n=1 Tax=Micropruina sp. TaxID=2737536 RepID=UPI0039E2549D